MGVGPNYQADFNLILSRDIKLLGSWMPTISCLNRKNININENTIILIAYHGKKEFLV